MDCYFLSFHVDDHFSNHSSLKWLSCDTGDVQNSCTEGMSFDTLILEVFNK